jgi:hypothetical protein
MLLPRACQVLPDTGFWQDGGTPDVVEFAVSPQVGAGGARLRSIPFEPRSQIQNS